MAQWTNTTQYIQLLNQQLPSYGQVSFPATQVPSADPNTLDDYEEGTWTSTISAQSGTYTSVVGNGYYTKVGRAWHAYLDIIVTTNGTAAVATIATLPVTPAGNAAFCGRETGAFGYALASNVLAAQNLVVVKYDGTFAGTSGSTLRVGGTFVS